MKELLPLLSMALAIGIGAVVGNFITTKTGKKAIGWPIGVVIFLALVAFSGAVLPASRSHSSRAEFKRMSPCPANGTTRGPCPGYVVDHIKPLCAGGADHPANMQWQTVAEAKAKDREERQLCRLSK